MTAKQMKLGEQIRRAARASGLGNNAIARIIGIDKAAVSRFLTGRAGLSLAVLEVLADMLGLDVVARRPVKVAPPERPGRKPKKGR